jgi:lipid-binding SYLF domain-containing protein
LPIHAADTAQQRLTDTTDVLKEVMATPEKGIPSNLLDKAHCVVIVPGVKAGGFIVGAKYGKGFATCRQPHDGWGAPGGVTVEGGSVGFQIGATNTDLVMLVMNERGMRRLLEDKFTIGGDAAAAAGPVGRDVSAMTDLQLSADILSWSRAKGLFAGISLQGATMRNDMSSNKELYGRDLTNKEILMTGIKPPAAAQPLIAALDKYSPHEAPNQPVESRVQHGVSGAGNNADRSADRTTGDSQSTTTKTKKKTTTTEKTTEEQK